MSISTKKEPADFLRDGQSVILKPLVHFVNRKLQEAFSDKSFSYADDFFYSCDGQKGRLKTSKDGSIRWDFYDITKFIKINMTKEIEGQKIQFRSVIFPDLRKDFFHDIEQLQTCRNHISHVWYDGRSEQEKYTVEEVTHFISRFIFILNQISNEVNISDAKNDLNELEKILLNLKSDNQIEIAKNKFRELEKKDKQYKNEKISVSNPLTLKRVRKEKAITSKGIKTNAIILTFEETPIERTMYSFLDLDGMKQRKAESLIGKKVVTITWNYRFFNPILWFRNIYEFKEE